MSIAPDVLRTAFAVVGLSVAGGCSREALPTPCPDLAEGDLVISEIRGPQGGDDDFGEWVEVYNGSGGTVDLAGLGLAVGKLDGSGAGGFVVRSRGLEIVDGSYAVFGRFLPDTVPVHVDYGYAEDLDEELASSGVIELSACGVAIDTVVYRSLTDFGTLALDGAIDPPSADANNDEGAFCVDDTLDDQNPSAGVRGTPGEPNPTCP